MLTNIIDPAYALVNGAQGTIVGFYPPPPNNSVNYIPVFGSVEMDDSTVPMPELPLRFYRDDGRKF